MMHLEPGELATDWLARALGAIEATYSAQVLFCVEAGDWIGVDEAARTRRTLRSRAVSYAVRAITTGVTPPEVPDEPEDHPQEPPY